MCELLRWPLKKKVRMHWPGIEPGPPAWQASTPTTEPPMQARSGLLNLGSDNNKFSLWAYVLISISFESKLDLTVSRQECERQQCERHQCEANSANANSAKGSTVRMPTVRMRQRCECQQCECDSSAKDDSPNCAKPFPQLRQLDLDFRQAFLSFFTHLLHTRDRRLASEIPLKLSTLVAVDRLTSFDSVRRRCTKALRKQPVRRIEFSASKRTS